MARTVPASRPFVLGFASGRAGSRPQARPPRLSPRGAPLCPRPPTPPCPTPPGTTRKTDETPVSQGLDRPRPFMDDSPDLHGDVRFDIDEDEVREQSVA